MNERDFSDWSVRQDWLNFLTCDKEPDGKGKFHKIDKYFVTPNGIILKVAFSQDNLVFAMLLRENRNLGESDGKQNPRP